MLSASRAVCPSCHSYSLPPGFRYCQSALPCHSTGLSSAYFSIKTISPRSSFPQCHPLQDPLPSGNPALPVSPGFQTGHRSHLYNIPLPTGSLLRQQEMSRNPLSGSPPFLRWPGTSPRRPDPPGSGCSRISGSARPSTPQGMHSCSLAHSFRLL